MLNGLRTEHLRQAFLDACALDVHALKPGNVSVYAAGHGMSVADFIASAEAAVDALTSPGFTVGERILGAVEATRRAVGCNTNLGIVLLCAPILHAALRACAGASLRRELARVLASLDVSDARLAYRAIRLAAPGGLGDSPHHDVRDEPRVSLLAAMREASLRDSIARQYANGFADIFDLGLPSARRFTALWRSERWAASAVYLHLLARLPDSHIARKQGARKAAEVSEAAARLCSQLAHVGHIEQLSLDLLAWDAALKRAATNPGTSADLTVASFVAARAEQLLHTEFTHVEPTFGSRGNDDVGDSPRFPQSVKSEGEEHHG